MALPAVILTVGAIITFCSLLYSPETKGIELSDVVAGKGRKAGAAPGKAEAGGVGTV